MFGAWRKGYELSWCLSPASAALPWLTSSPLLLCQLIFKLILQSLFAASFKVGRRMEQIKSRQSLLLLRIICEFQLSMLNLSLA